MPAIAFEGVTKVFGDRAAREGRPAAVRDVTLEVEQGELIVLLGPSGCGKTTMMRMVNRLIEPTSGSIYVDGQEIHQVPATQLRRHIGYVIQQVGLFPHMTVAANVDGSPPVGLGQEAHRGASGRITRNGGAPARRFSQALPTPAVGRSTTARRHRTGHGRGSGGVAYGRAFWCHRRDNPPGPSESTDSHPAANQQDHHL